MRVGEFFAWADALPELQRQETLQAINVQLIAGQRAVSQEDFKGVIRDLRRPIRKLGDGATPEQVREMQRKADAANKAFSRLGQTG